MGRRFLLASTLTPLLPLACSGGTSASSAASSAPPSNDASEPDAASPRPGDAGPKAEAGPEADAGPEAGGTDYGAPSSTYPAFTPEMGQIVNHGGNTISAPVIVTITWKSDASAAMLEAFADAIGPSAYWQAANGEYGIAAASSGAADHVRVASTPAQLADSDIRKLILANAGTTWPAATSQTIYLFFLAPGTSLLSGTGDACAQGVGGYHDNQGIGTVKAGYSVIPRCGSGQAAIDLATAAASHELGETVTDLRPNTVPAWRGYDAPHLAFEDFVQGQDETGDVCELYADSFYAEAAPLAFMVQRMWSNRSAAVGHAPCVPAPAGAYFNTTPIALEDVTVNLTSSGGSSQSPTRGIRALVGQTVTFPIGFYSDAPTDAWQIRVDEGNPILGPPSTKHLSVSLDPAKTTGQNGEKSYVTATVLSAGKTNAELVTVTSTTKSRSTYMPILIGSQ